MLWHLIDYFSKSFQTFSLAHENYYSLHPVRGPTFEVDDLNNISFKCLTRKVNPIILKDKDSQSHTCIQRKHVERVFC